ncbi:MAG TPA: hypothetical protein VK157_11610 [Phycisphaerales bacterium]|nr:hypothetical protein [Phycisphaerales bacterium]
MLIITALALASLAPAQVDATAIAIAGQPAPGLPAVTHTTPALIAVSPDGHVLLASTLANTTTTNDTAILTWRDGVTRLVAQENDPAPGVAGSVFDIFRVPRIDRTGRVAMTVRTRGASANEVIYQELQPGTLSLIAALGQRPPLFTTGSFNAIKQPWLTADGALSFVGDVTSASPGSRTLFTYVNGTGRYYARQGDIANFIPGNPTFTFGNPTTEFIMAGANEVGVFRTLANGLCFIHGAPGQLQVLARTGATPPGFSPPSSVSGLSDITIGDDGTAAATITITNPTTSALIAGRPGAITLVAKPTDVVPNYTPGATFVSIPTPPIAGYPSSGLLVGPGGHLLFRANITDTAPVTARTALMLRDPDGTMRPVAVTGRELGTTGITPTSITPLNYHVNRRGDVLFVVGYAANFAFVHWSRERGHTIVYSSNQRISVDGSAPESVTLTTFSLRSSLAEGAPLILQSVFADDGTFAFTCRLATGNAFAILSMRVPQPCDSIDFNNNQVFPEDQDVIDFFNVLAGGDCPTCNDIDFNNNSVFPEDQDVIDFFTILAGGTC